VLVAASDQKDPFSHRRRAPEAALPVDRLKIRPRVGRGIVPLGARRPAGGDAAQHEDPVVVRHRRRVEPRGRHRRDLEDVTRLRVEDVARIEIILCCEHVRARAPTEEVDPLPEGSRRQADRRLRQAGDTCCPRIGGDVVDVDRVPNLAVDVGPAERVDLPIVSCGSEPLPPLRLSRHQIDRVGKRCLFCPRVRRRIVRLDHRAGRHVVFLTVDRHRVAVFDPADGVDQAVHHRRCSRVSWQWQCCRRRPLDRDCLGSANKADQCRQHSDHSDDHPAPSALLFHRPPLV